MKQEEKKPIEANKAEEIPLRKHWWLSVKNERGSDNFEAFDFIKIKLTSGDIEIPITSVGVQKIDGLVLESHSIVSKLIHMNTEALQKENEKLKAKLEKACEALRFYENTSVGEGYGNLKFPARAALKEIEGE